MDIPAAKIVFILVAAALVALTWAGRVDPKDFVVLCSMAFAFYFATPAGQTPSGGNASK